MKVGIIDADLIGRKKHRFPNLACEKISSYWKEKGAEVIFLMGYEWAEDFDHIYISKVFIDTPIPEWIHETNKVHLGGTGFFFDKAPDLPEEIEHCTPDYNLYPQQFKEYTDYSRGFLTRGCFRKCKFCVNQKYDHVFAHSPLSEFYDPNRKKICLLDDNFFGYPDWKPLLQELINTKKPFVFKQGLDERILTDEKCEMLFRGKYDGDYIFAFDNIADYNIIKEKLQMLRRHTKSKSLKFYILVGFESIDFTDILNTFKRIELLMEYKCLPYIMRYQGNDIVPWQKSEHRGMYITLARWCNQPSIFKKMSFRQFCEANQALHKTKGVYCSAMKALKDFEMKYPDIAREYFDMRFDAKEEERAII